MGVLLSLLYSKHVMRGCRLGYQHLQEGWAYLCEVDREQHETFMRILRQAFRSPKD